LQNVEFLRGADTGPNRLSFDVDLQAAGPDVSPLVSDQFRGPQHFLAVNAAVGFEPRDCTATYAAATRILTKPLQLIAHLDGDTQRVNVRKVRTLPGSPIQLG